MIPDVSDTIHPPNLADSLQIPICCGLLHFQLPPNFNFYLFPFFLLLLYEGFFCKITLLSNQVNANYF
ncbi:unnamed protein product [Coffea canephora]|uniref:DH200=94 genomic scaffold, scaffold_675 n=1 Tax=Coffea canephora TaxID=49390 RepID=A0A068VJC8_COFCA|nr:unnamed protein product [Coffea canephora]